MCLLVSDHSCDVVTAAVDDEDPWSVFTCPPQPLITFSVISPGSPFPPAQVYLTIMIQWIYKSR